MMGSFSRRYGVGVAAVMTLFVVTPTAAQEPAYDAVIFFDWGKLEISRDAAGTLDRLVERLTTEPARQLQLDGFSDRSGPEGVNQRISQQRARLVRDYLVCKGVAEMSIRISGHGEQQVLIPTEDGVREVQNRRVEIRVLGEER